MKTINLIIININFNAISVFLDWFLGEPNNSLYVLLIFIIVNYITGIFCAINKHKLSNEIIFWELIRKILILTLIGLGHCLDVYIFKNGSTIRAIIILFYISTEGTSLLENISQLGLPVPEKLKIDLRHLYKDEDKNDLNN